MSHAVTAGTNDERTPPLSKDLDAVQVHYTWKFGEGGREGASQATGESEPEGDDDARARLEARLKQLTAALEDIVTLALSSADYKERAIMMHRRAVAALTAPPPGGGGDR